MQEIDIQALNDQVQTLQAQLNHLQTVVALLTAQRLDPAPPWKITCSTAQHTDKTLLGKTL